MIFAKLTEEQVAEIRKSDSSPKEIASRYGISRSHISNIKKGVAWKAKKPIHERFENKLQSTANDCVIFNGLCNPDGYGRFEQKLAHRVAYELYVGTIPDGLCVLHRCDNPPCCNADHLFVDTRGGNNHDRSIKGRSYRPQGEKHPNVKLTPEKVRYIRASSKSNQELAKELGVHYKTIDDVRYRRTWKHID